MRAIIYVSLAQIISILPNPATSIAAREWRSIVSNMRSYDNWHLMGFVWSVDGSHKGVYEIGTFRACLHCDNGFFFVPKKLI